MKTFFSLFALITVTPLIAQVFLPQPQPIVSPPTPTVAQPAAPVSTQVSRSDILTHDQWHNIDNSVDRGLAWLASQQLSDGSFPTYETGQPAVTSFVIMAFLSRGHVPGFGPYGKTLDRAIDFVLEQQRDDGLFFSGATDMPASAWGQGSHTAMYNHAIAGLMLGEAYGMTDGARAKKLRPAILKAMEFARKMQRRPKPDENDNWAWRYYKEYDRSRREADLSVSGWFLMFYRSAKNAEFDVPKEHVDEAIMFVKRCYDAEKGAFTYGQGPSELRYSRGMTGAGVLSMVLAGHFDKDISEATGKWILSHPFTVYNQGSGGHDRYHYGAYYCSQAMFVLGGEYWKQFYRQLSDTMLAHQAPQGNWQPEAAQHDEIFGNCYTTALAILSLTPPYQMLPIYQK